MPRTIEQHLENLDQIRSQPTHNISVRGSMARANILQREVNFCKKHFCASSHILCSQRTLRKREVTLSRINIYIVYIIVSCHTVRIIPNAWEIVHRWDHRDHNCELLPQKLWGSRWKSFTPWAKSFLSLLIKNIMSPLLQKCIDWWLTVSW